MNQAAQLFDLASDPNEWHNLVGFLEYVTFEEQLWVAIFQQFDIESIVPTMLTRLRKKMIECEAMHRNGTQWDYQPHFDATQQYMRASVDDPYMRKSRTDWFILRTGELAGPPPMDDNCSIPAIPTKPRQRSNNQSKCHLMPRAS